MDVRRALAAVIFAAFTACGGSSDFTANLCAGGFDDGDACTVDACDPATGDVTHDPVAVDDGDACTADSCGPASGVAHDPIDPDDGDACTVDACDPASGVSHIPVAVDDGIACTVDSCDPVSGVVHAPDDLACGTGEFCHPLAGCIAVPVLEYCILDYPFTVPVAAGSTTPFLRGDVGATGVTEADGPSPLVVAEVGYGAFGSDPRAGGWTWFAAGYRRQGPWYDEYEEQIAAPTVAGGYAFTYRFSIDQGATFAYCDMDGASAAQDDFDPALLGEMTVTP